jgi:RNA-binding motif X-linked protein 2
MNVISEIQRINAVELSSGLTHTSASWHTKYASSAWINVGSLPLNLTEGDVICIFSQYGEIEDIHLVRDGDTGKSRGFAFVKYEDARSCVLAVDNLCGCQVLGRQLRVDHVDKYRLPKHVQEREENNEAEGADNSNNNNSAAAVAEAGHAYKGQELASEYDIHAGQDLFAAPSQKQQLEKDENNQRENELLLLTNSKAERKRRKEERAQKRKEKEEHRRRKEDRKRRKHSSSHHHGKEKRRRRSRSRSRSRSHS